METPDATTAGIMRLEATWSVLAHVKRFLVRSLEELRQRVTVGGPAWATAVAAMGGWGRHMLADHVCLEAWRPAYQIMATQYAMGVAPHHVSAGGQVSIPSAGLFMEAVVRNASATPAIRDGTILTSTTGDQDRVTADVLRTALGEVFHHVLQRGPSSGDQQPRPASHATVRTSPASTSTVVRSAVPTSPPAPAARASTTTAASSLTPDDSVSVAPAMAQSLDDLHRSCFFSLAGGDHVHSEAGGALDPPVSMAETVDRR